MTKLEVIDNQKVLYEMRSALSDGLFRPLKRGDRKKLKLDLVRNFGPLSFHFTCYEPLSIDDENVLLAILALSKPNGIRLTTGPESDHGKKIRELLNPKAYAENWDAGYVKTSVYEICKLAGYPAEGSGYKTVKASLKRLSSVVLWIKNEETEREGSMSLIGSYFNGNEDLYIGIHHQLANAVFGDQQYAIISLKDRLLLKGDVARMIHRWLSAWMPAKSKRSIGIEKLCCHVWPDYLKSQDGTKRWCWNKVKLAIKEINNLASWKINFKGLGAKTMVLIDRNP